MKTLYAVVLLLVGVVGFVACAPVAGDGCNEAAECGSALNCVSCNASADAGPGSDEYLGTCQKICEEDADCVGVDTRHGPATICAQNACGVRYCSFNPF